MVDLVRIDAAMIVKTVIPVLREFQEVAGAFHFGSSLGMASGDGSCLPFCLPCDSLRTVPHCRTTA
ncbi:MAG: hypothetical protein ACOY9Y_15145 [Bacillota bacterium]